MILAGRNPERLQRAASELGALRTAAFDATDFAQLETFFEELRAPIDHVMVTGPGPYYALLAGLDLEKARHDVDGLAAADDCFMVFETLRVRKEGPVLFAEIAAPPISNG